MIELTNTFAAGCWQCGHPVPSGAGVLESTPHGWKVRCRPCLRPRTTCGECGISKATHLVPDGVCVDCR